MFETRNNLRPTIRDKAVGLLNCRLADCIDLQTQVKRAHWNVRGANFISLHKLIDEINRAVVDYVDSFKPSANPQVVQRRREAGKAAESWFAGEPGAPLEFELCCAMFGTSADQMRAKIKLLTKRLSAPWN